MIYFIHCRYHRAVDWWAFGVLIFEMVCGHPPFYSENPMEIYKQVSWGYCVPPKRSPSSGMVAATSRDEDDTTWSEVQPIPLLHWRGCWFHHHIRQYHGDLGCQSDIPAQKVVEGHFRQPRGLRLWPILSFSFADKQQILSFSGCWWVDRFPRPRLWRSHGSYQRIVAAQSNETARESFWWSIWHKIPPILRQSPLEISAIYESQSTLYS